MFQNTLASTRADTRQGKSSGPIVRSTMLTSSGQATIASQRRVLIGEFRDGVIANLSGIFEEHGYLVFNANCGMAVSSQVDVFRPELVLLNEHLSDQSGWLVAGKLRMMHTPPTVWLYAAQMPRLVAGWKAVCGIDEMFAHCGILDDLYAQVLCQLSLLSRGFEANGRHRFAA